MSKLHLKVRSGLRRVPARQPSRRCRSAGATARRRVKFHWIVVPGATDVSIWRRSPSNSIAVASGFGLDVAVGRAEVARPQERQRPVGAFARRDVEREPDPHLRGVEPGGAQAAVDRVGAVGVDVLEREPEQRHVALVPARRHEHGRGVGQDLAQQVGDRRLALGVLAGQVGDQLDAEADVALLVLGDVGDALAKAREQVALGSATRR